MTGLIDKDQKIAHLNKEFDQLEGEIQRILNKLNSNGFMAKAPAAVVEKERQKLEACEQGQLKVKEQINKIQSSIG